MKTTLWILIIATIMIIITVVFLEVLLKTSLLILDFGIKDSLPLGLRPYNSPAAPSQHASSPSSSLSRSSSSSSSSFVNLHPDPRVSGGAHAGRIYFHQLHSHANPATLLYPLQCISHIHHTHCLLCTK